MSSLGLRDLRSWLASSRRPGKSRTTIARRATAARVFTAWLARTGRTEADAGWRWGSRPRAAHPAPGAAGRRGAN
ncbi:MAG: site-specific integrase [Nocardioides sp.]